MQSVSLFNLPVHRPARPGPDHPLLRAAPLCRVRSSRTVMEWLRFRKSIWGRAKAAVGDTAPRMPLPLTTGPQPGRCDRATLIQRRRGSG